MQRPTGVTILAILIFIAAGFELLFAIGLIVSGSFLSSIANAPGAPILGKLIGALGAAAGLFFLLVAALWGAIGYGLLKLQNWARITHIALLIIGLAFGLFRVLQIFSAFTGGDMMSQLFYLGIDAWILCYLFQPHVKQAFSQQRQPSQPKVS